MATYTIDGYPTRPRFGAVEHIDITAPETLPTLQVVEVTRYGGAISNPKGEPPVPSKGMADKLLADSELSLVGWE